MPIKPYRIARAHAISPTPKTGIKNGCSSLRTAEVYTTGPIKAKRIATKRREIPLKRSSLFIPPNVLVPIEHFHGFVTIPLLFVHPQLMIHKPSELLFLVVFDSTIAYQPFDCL